MSTTCKLIPVKENICIQASYGIGGGKVAMLVNGEYYEVDTNKKKSKDESELNPDLLIFGGSMRSLDIGNKGSDKYKFWSKHPAVAFYHNPSNAPGEDGHNPNLVGQPLAYLYDVDAISANKYSEFKMLLTVLSAVNNCDTSSLNDLLYFLNENPKSYSGREAILGALFSPTGKFIVPDIIRKVNSYFVERERGNTLKQEAVVLANRALMEGVMTKDGKGYIYFEDRAIGELQDVVAKIVSSTDFRDSLAERLGVKESKSHETKRGRKKVEEATEEQLLI